MTTINFDGIVRIDIMEGPNLEGLLKPWLMLNLLGEEDSRLDVDEIWVRLDEVAYFDEGGAKLDKRQVGVTLTIQLLSLGALGDELKNIRAGDVVITALVFGMTFRGHYNTHKRKGSLQRLRCSA